MFGIICMEETKKILVVDDDVSILDTLEMVLTYYGYDVAKVSRGDKVFEQINQYHPDLILMDIMLAGMDGRVICSAIKSEMEDMPVILISATESGATCMDRNGAPDDFVQKPFDVNTLIERIEHQLAA